MLEIFDCLKLFEWFQQFIVITIDFEFFNINWNNRRKLASIKFRYDFTFGLHATEKSLESYWAGREELNEAMKFNEAINVRFIYKWK